MQAIILQPVLALVTWTLIIWIWLYATRLPAIFKARINFKHIKNGADLRRHLPEKVNWVADNYNHLFEQPVIFYATCFVLALHPPEGGAHIGLAWAYVALRVAHSLWQCLFNQVPVRFFIFTLSTLVLAALLVTAVTSFI